jgi:translation initiation factor 3 subunit D
MDKARASRSLILPSFTGNVYNVQTLEDPVFQRLAKENKADIFATETAVSAIMTSTKSLYSWDVIIKKY